MKTLKTVHIITRLEAGGSSTNTIACAEELGAGFDTLLVCGQTEGGAQAAEPKTARTVYIPQLKRSLDLFSDLSALRALVLLLRAERPDIVHTHTSKAGILGRWAAFFYNTFCGGRAKIIHTPHGHIFYGYFGKAKTAVFVLAEKITAAITDRLIALSSGELEENLSRGIGRRAQWMIIPSGVNLPDEAELAKLKARRMPLRAQAGFGESDTVVGSVARLEPVKGETVFARAIPEVLKKFPAARFIIVGDGAQRGEMENILRGHEGAIFMAGFRRDAQAWMAAMDIYVQPSVNEGLGRTLIEAQQLGLPVAASAVCGIPDIIKEGENGLLVQPQNHMALADAICRLLADRPLAQRLGQNSARLIAAPDENGLPRFTTQAMLEKLRRLYRSFYP